MAGKAAPTNGRGVDASGRTAIDPSTNVLDLVDASEQRQDDLRFAAEKLQDVRTYYVERIVNLNADHAKEMAGAESKRLDAIRQVDVLNQSMAAERAGEGIKILATQTASIAEAGRTTMANTATQMAAQLTSLFAESNKRLSAVELAMSEGRGKQAVVDPQMERLANVVEKLAAAQTVSAGKSAGADWLWKAILAAAGVGMALYAAMNK